MEKGEREYSEYPVERTGLRALAVPRGALHY
jgi:hypothetical protein